MAMSRPSPTPPQEGEEGLSHDCKELLSSLPTTNGGRFTHLYQYEGFWYNQQFLLGIIACQRHFQAHDSDLLLATTPKSGTTWLKALAFAITNRARYPFPQHPLLTNNPHKLVPYLEMNLYYGNSTPDPERIRSLGLFSTHMPYTSLPQSIKDSNCKVVYLCRNPGDVFISFWHFSNNLKVPETQSPISLEDAFDLFCAGISMYGPFWDHVLGYWKESKERPEKVMFLKYEDLKREPVAPVKRLAEFLGCPFTPQEDREGMLHDILKLCSFENLSNLEVNKIGKTRHGNNDPYEVEHKHLFRRGEVGDSLNYLTTQMIERLDQIMEEKLQGYDLTFQVSV
ncbi:cytosolic sulfotransferase 13-like [Magnolia sinica]|uniref:cytosolic sulfotransferase 13-like n=1 Tax=Magnolia sinica TaxID=86752 RepID=UPI002658BF12|nr:cytosolic sulfotransferase 13-like [Magnolia sinica]